MQRGSDDNPGGVGGRRTRAGRRGVGPWPVVLVIGLIGFLILRQEVPAVDAWLEGWIAPERARARSTCIAAALDAATQPAFARVLMRGQVSETRAGYYVEGIRIGEMGPDGAERVYVFSCYLDTAGALAGTHRQPVSGTGPLVTEEAE